MPRTTKCYFCHRDGVQLSLEHLVSEPIARAAGIDRASDYYADVDGQSGSVSNGPAPVLAHAARGPCVECNSGWMSSLEVEAAAAIERLAASDYHKLSNRDQQVLGAWMLKMYIVSGFRLAKFLDPFDDDGLKAPLVHSPRQSKELANGEWSTALARTHLAVGRHDSSWGLSAFGNASTTPGRMKLFVGVFVFGFPRLDRQLWLVNNLLEPGAISWPERLETIDGTVKLRGSSPDVSAVEVTFPITDEEAKALI